MVKEGKIDEEFYRALEKKGFFRRDELVEVVGLSVPQGRFFSENPRGYALVDEQLRSMGYEHQED